jgi:hypothetical protein
MENEITDSINQLQRSSGNRSSSSQVETVVRSCVRRILKEENGKQPQIIVNITNI